MVHSDDDVQIIAEGKRNQNDASFICQLCSKDMRKLDVAQRQQHYEIHFRSSDMNDGYEASHDVNVKPKSRRKWKEYFPCNNENDKFWYSALTEPPPSNHTPGNLFRACPTVT